MTKDVYTALGFVSSLRYKQGQNEWELSFDPHMSWKGVVKKSVYVMIAKGKTEIFLVKWNPKPIAIPKNSGKQKNLVRQWYGWDAHNAFKITMPSKRLLKNGRITRIEYTSDKFDEKGDKRGKFHLYRHDFVKTVPFFISKDETFFSFKHPTLFNERGIIA